MLNLTLAGPLLDVLSDCHYIISPKKEHEAGCLIDPRKEAAEGIVLTVAPPNMRKKLLSILLNEGSYRGSYGGLF